MILAVLFGKVFVKALKYLILSPISRLIVEKECSFGRIPRVRKWLYLDCSCTFTAWRIAKMGLSRTI